MAKVVYEHRSVPGGFGMFVKGFSGPSAGPLGTATFSQGSDSPKVFKPHFWATEQEATAAVTKANSEREAFEQKYIEGA